MGHTRTRVRVLVTTNTVQLSQGCSANAYACVFGETASGTKHRGLGKRSRLLKLCNLLCVVCAIKVMATRGSDCCKKVPGIQIRRCKKDTGRHGYGMGAYCAMRMAWFLCSASSWSRSGARTDAA